VAVEDTSDTAHVMSAVKEIYATYGIDTIRNKQRFISILRDYIPEYEKEMRLLITAIDNNVIDGLSRGANDVDSAIAKARDYMENDMFLSKMAIEFIIQVTAYMFGWDYKPVEDVAQPAPQPTVEAAPANPQPDTNGAKPKSKGKANGKVSVNTPEEDTNNKAHLENKVFSASEASKFRFKTNVEIPSGYTAIKGFAFDEFNLLKSINIPDGVIAIGEYAFSNCTRLSAVRLPNTLRFLKTSAFESCVKLTSIKIPKGVVSIEDGTFQFCERLQTIEIPDTVGSIGSSAFSCCESLKDIFIPDSVKYIGEGVFEYCPDIVVKCYEYSYVHKYCQSAGIKYSLIEQA
jgi:hypothetical protein